VREIKKEGADFVKVYSFLPRDEYFAIADEAKKQGLTFAGHVPFGVSVEEASESGQKSIEHLTGIGDSYSNHADELHKLAAEDLAEMIASGKPSLAGGSHVAASGLSVLDSYSAEKCAVVFARFKKNSTWVCPTLALFRTMAMADDPSLVNDDRVKYMPRQLRESWDPKTNYLFTMAAMNRSYIKKQYQYDLDLVAALDKADVGIIAGTDTSNPYSMPGFSLLDELAHYVEAGLAPMAALQTATRNPARFLGKEKDMGTIEQGKIADLVLLEANPLEDIRNTKKIASVVFEGKLFPKSAIDGMLADAEKLASRKSIAETLFRTIQEKDVDAALRQYRVLKTTQPAAYEFSEDELNGLGYRLLGMKKKREAVEILKLCAEEYPESYNAYDSLGEAYMNNGEKDLAIKNYRKSMQLNPKNLNAVEMLKKLNAP
jgi:imidazolonepropionase-like amidohydrolase